MLITIFILLQIIVITGLIITFHTETPLSSAITATISGILMVGSWVLNVGNEYVWDPSIRAYTREAIIIKTPYLPSINFLIFSLAILFLFYDVFKLWKDESTPIQNVNPSTK